MLSFQEIDESRRRAGLTRKELYEKAGIDKETWRRTASGRTVPNLRTLQKLGAALKELIEERAAA